MNIQNFKAKYWTRTRSDGTVAIMKGANEMTTTEIIEELLTLDKVRKISEGGIV